MARLRFEAIKNAISEKRTAKIEILFKEITVPDIFDQQSLKLVFEYFI